MIISKPIYKFNFFDTGSFPFVEKIVVFVLHGIEE